MRTANLTRRRRASIIIAAALALALLLTGTYAWMSVDQRATNQLSGDDFPGGRIHDDFDGDGSGWANKDVYGENYGNLPLFVRIKLTEYMEIDGQSFSPFASKTDKTTWATHHPGHLQMVSEEPLEVIFVYGDPAVCDNMGNSDDGFFHDYVTWYMGGDLPDSPDKYFMPTFNKDNTNLSTDASGNAIDDLTGGQTASGDGSHGFWGLGDPELGDEYKSTGITPDVTHHARANIVADYPVMTMADYKDMVSTGGPATGNFWVYDADGWAYWANYLMPGDATSLLLDSIHMDEIEAQWYYAINVIGEFYSDADYGTLINGGDITNDGMNLIKAIQAAEPNWPNKYELLSYLQRARELAIQAATDTYEGTERWTIYYGSLYPPDYDDGCAAFCLINAKAALQGVLDDGSAAKYGVTSHITTVLSTLTQLDEDWKDAADNGLGASFYGGPDGDGVVDVLDGIFADIFGVPNFPTGWVIQPNVLAELGILW